MTSPLNLPAPGRCRAVYVYFRIGTALCFGKQLPGPIRCALSCEEGPFIRSYRVSLPSSLTVIHPSASVYSTRPRVSVYGTGATRLMFSGFSWRHGYLRCCLARKGAAYFEFGSCRGFAGGSLLPTPFNRLFRQPAAVSHPRHRVTPGGSTGILTGSAIGLAWRLSLRARLTAIRLALIEKPWSFGEGFTPPLSLLIPTFAFPYAPADLAGHLRRQMECSPTDTVRIPRLRQAPYTRLLSMPATSTSELLRTL